MQPFHQFSDVKSKRGIILYITHLSMWMNRNLNLKIEGELIAQNKEEAGKKKGGRETDNMTNL